MMANNKTTTSVVLPQDLSLAAYSESVFIAASPATASGGPLTPAAATVTPGQTTSAGATDAAPLSATLQAPAATINMVAGAQPAGNSTAGQAGIGTYIVFLDGIQGSERANFSARVTAVLRSLGSGITTQENFDYLNGFSIRLSDQQAQRLRALSGVKSVEADGLVQLVKPPSPGPAAVDPITGISALPQYADQFVPGSSERIPWGVNAVWSGNQAGFLANPGNGKYAYIIDTGIAPTTGDLNVDMAKGYNWVSTSTPAADDNGHGTHVAGTIGALANGYGVVGVAAGASVVPLKVLDASGSGSLTNVISAINYVLSNLSQRGISKASAVVNLSLGSATTWTSLDTAIVNAANQGLRFAIAAGNSGRDVDGFTPARTGNNANVYTASAVDSAYKMASWSNWDKLTTRDKIDNIDYAAPGVNVMSLSNQTGYLATMSGTSMASPHLAGLLLVGGITSGGLVTPYLSGTADPFALHA